MGYYTKFIINAPDYVVERLEEISGYSFDDTCKWYDHQEQITQVSTEYPAVLITVTGYGEKVGDIWRAYSLNGQFQREQAIITFPPCIIKQPEIITETVYITISGHDVPVEVEYVKGTDKDTVYRMAKEKLKSLL